MSLFKGLKKIVRAGGRAVAGYVGVGGLLPPSGPNSPPGFPGMASLPPLPRMGAGAMMVLPGAGAILSRGVGALAARGAGAAVGAGLRLSRRGLQVISRNRMKALGYLAIGGLVYDAAGNLIGETAKRRMNPLNHRALSRSIRRVCAARKICKKVDKIAGASPARRAKCAPRARKC